MKTKTLIALLLGVGLSAGSAVFAQDVLMEIQMTVSDAGVEAVREAQEAPAPVAKKNLSPLRELQNIAREHKWRTGWDGERKRFIAIVSDTVDSDNPATDKDFFLKREAASRRAYLRAKTKIIEFFNQEMSASDSIFTPGTDIRAKFEEEMTAYETKMAEEKEKLAKLVERYNRAEAAELRGTTISDRLNDLMVAIIKKLDETYNADAQDEKLKAELAEAKKNLEEQMAVLAKIKKEAEESRKSLVREQVSEVTTMASMPLYGATVLMQLEGYDQKYQVAMIVVWSAALERAARAVVTHEPFKLTPKPDAPSLDEWLEKQDFSCMIGPRTFLDKDGNRIFLGIAADECNDKMDSVAQQQAQDFAALRAGAATMFSVKGDVEAYKCAKLMVNTYRNALTGEAQEKAMKSVETNISQNLAIKSNSGLQPVLEDNFVHAITNREIYVAVYEIDPTSVQEALEGERINYATKIQDERRQSLEAGRKQANEAAVNAARNRQDDIRSGAARQGQALSEELQRREAEKSGSGTGVKIIETTPAGTPEKKENQPTRGVFGGDVIIDEDF